MADIILAGSTSGSITVSSPSVSGSSVLTLPAVTDTLVGLAATQTLTNKTLTTPNLGTPSTLVLTNATGLAAAAMPAGSVLQVVSTTKTDTFSVASVTFTDITGLSVSITPSSASNKILIWAHLPTGNGTGSIPYYKLVRGSTDICIGDAASSRPRITASSFVSNPDTSGCAAINFLDSPASTSSTTYKIQMRGYDTVTVYLNRTSNDTDASYGARAAATITVMEIKG